MAYNQKNNAGRGNLAKTGRGLSPNLLVNPNPDKPKPPKKKKPKSFVDAVSTAFKTENKKKENKFTETSIDSGTSNRTQTSTDILPGIIAGAKAGARYIRNKITD